MGTAEVLAGLGERQPKQEANDATQKGEFAVETACRNTDLLVQRVNPHGKSQWWFVRQLSSAFSTDRSKRHAVISH